MDDLIAWLRAQLDEDERIALATFDVNVRVAMSNGAATPRWIPDPETSGVRDEGGVSRVHHTWHREREHIARHDPARVLADVAAKRAILDLHYIIERKVNWIDAEGDDWQNHQPVCVICVEKYSLVTIPDDLGPCKTVHLLATAYADRPGWREEWRP